LGLGKEPELNKLTIYIPSPQRFPEGRGSKQWLLFATYMIQDCTSNYSAPLFEKEGLGDIF
jgi:hypothetical protein